MEKIEKNGVTYYIENDTCVDLEVPASIQELAFYDFGGKIKKISLRNVQKSFSSHQPVCERNARICAEPIFSFI